MIRHKTKIMNQSINFYVNF